MKPIHIFNIYGSPRRVVGINKIVRSGIYDGLWGLWYALAFLHLEGRMSFESWFYSRILLQDQAKVSSQKFSEN